MFKSSLFSHYNRTLSLPLSKSRPFCNSLFVFPTPSRDAEDAVHARDGYDYDGYKLRVEFPRGGGSGGGGMGGGFRGSGGGGGGRGPPARRSQYRCMVTGLPPTGSWQDLKDHMREAGDVCFSDVFKDGTGVVEYMRYDDMKYAVKKLDDSRFRSHEVLKTYFSFAVILITFLLPFRARPPTSV